MSVMSGMHVQPTVHAVCSAGNYLMQCWMILVTPCFLCIDQNVRFSGVPTISGITAHDRRNVQLGAFWVT